MRGRWLKGEGMPLVGKEGLVGRGRQLGRLVGEEGRSGAVLLEIG